MTAHRQFTSATERKTIHGSNDRFAATLKTKKTILSALGQGHRFFFAELIELADIRSCHKGFWSGSRQNHTADGRIGIDLIHHGIQVIEYRSVECVEFIGTIHGCRQDALLQLGQ